MAEESEYPTTDGIDTDTTDESSEDEDTYHEFNKVVRISSLAKVFSWISLGFAVVLLIADVFLVVATLSGATGLDRGYLIMQTLDTSVRSFLPILFGGFFFVLLQAISEGVYIWLDIEGNTRHSAAVLDDHFGQGGAADESGC
jgi:hypothetical protein